MSVFGSVMAATGDSACVVPISGGSQLLLESFTILDSGFLGR